MPKLEDLVTVRLEDESVDGAKRTLRLSVTVPDGEHVDAEYLQRKFKALGRLEDDVKGAIVGRYQRANEQAAAVQQFFHADAAPQKPARVRKPARTTETPEPAPEPKPGPQKLDSTHTN